MALQCALYLCLFPSVKNILHFGLFLAFFLFFFFLRIWACKIVVSIVLGWVRGLLSLLGFTMISGCCSFWYFQNLIFFVSGLINSTEVLPWIVVGVPTVCTYKACAKTLYLKSSWFNYSNYTMQNSTKADQPVDPGTTRHQHHLLSYHAVLVQLEIRILLWLCGNHGNVLWIIQEGGVMWWKSDFDSKSLFISLHFL